MQYRQDLCSGNELSVLGFGCMRLPRGIGGGIDLKRSEDLICRAAQQGVNYFDTAYVYPGSEQALGTILQRTGLRSKVYLATKLPHQKCKATADLERFFNEQLQRLQTERVDYYLIHNISSTDQWRRLVSLGILEWIEAKKASGQIGQVGFSFHGQQAAFAELLDLYDWEFCQIQYNYCNQEYQAGRAGLQRAYDYGLPVIIMEPLLGGKLSTGLPKAAEKLLRDADPTSSPAAWALRWLWNQPEPTMVLSGMNSASQLEENLSLAAAAQPGMFSQHEQEVLEQVVIVFTEHYKVPCTGCNYCMPCPYGVNIPDCFAAYNLSYAVGMVAGLTLYITSTRANSAADNSRANKCRSCGACEKKCPQNIQIASELRALRKRLEPWWFQILLKVLQRVV